MERVFFFYLLETGTDSSFYHFITFVEFVINTNIAQSTGFVLFELLNGQLPVAPINYLNSIHCTPKD